MINSRYYKIYVFIIIIVLLTIREENSFAQETSLPVSTQFQIFQKVLSFNRSKPLNSNPLILGVIYQSKFRTSLNVAMEIEKYFLENEVKVSGNVIKIQLIDILNENLSTSINMYPLTYAYIAPMRAYDITSIHKLLAPRNILTMSGVPEYSENYDISIAIGTNSGNPQIILNRKSYIEEGADFSAQLLKLKFIKIIE
ncbi:MAG: hypothetical protein JST20_00050 [Bacteroidetes bacterium]|nr:hypothetical protein [Bacteroidota bacterium]